MNGADGPDESMHQGETADADLSNPDADLTAFGVYTIFLNYIRKLLSDPNLVISYKVTGKGMFDSIEIEKGDNVLNRICMVDESVIVCIKLIGWYDGGVSSMSRAPSIEFTLNNSSETLLIEGDKTLLIRGLKRRIKRKFDISEETGAKSGEIKHTSDKSKDTDAKSGEGYLIETLQEIIKMCNEAISKHGGK
jgi:hypothetical protein